MNPQRPAPTGEDTTLSATPPADPSAGQWPDERRSGRHASPETDPETPQPPPRRSVTQLVTVMPELPVPGPPEPNQPVPHQPRADRRESDHPEPDRRESDHPQPDRRESDHPEPDRPESDHPESDQSAPDQSAPDQSAPAAATPWPEPAAPPSADHRPHPAPDQQPTPTPRQPPPPTQPPSLTRPTQLPPATHPTEIPPATHPTEIPPATHPTEIPSATHPTEIPSLTRRSPSVAPQQPDPGGPPPGPAPEHHRQAPTGPGGRTPRTTQVPPPRSAASAPASPVPAMPYPTAGALPAPDVAPGGIRRVFARGAARQNEAHRAENEARIAAPLPGPRRIAVVGLKGGVGKTTVALSLAAAYTRIRREPTLFLDADPTFGSLLVRAGITAQSSAHDIAGRGDPGSLEPMLPFLARSPLDVLVLPAGLDPAGSAAFDEDTYAGVMDVVHRHLPISVTDCGAGLSGALLQQVLAASHTLVCASSPSVDSLLATHSGLSWIASRGYARLVASSIVVVTGQPERGGVDLTSVHQRFVGLCRGVVAIPQDPHLSAGGPLDPDQLAAPTDSALVALAADALDSARAAG